MLSNQIHYHHHFKMRLGCIGSSTIHDESPASILQLAWASAQISRDHSIACINTLNPNIMNTDHTFIACRILVAYRQSNWLALDARGHFVYIPLCSCHLIQMASIFRHIFSKRMIRLASASNFIRTVPIIHGWSLCAHSTSINSCSPEISVSQNVGEQLARAYPGNG